jgi:hypothetical protein
MKNFIIDRLLSPNCIYFNKLHLHVIIFIIIHMHLMFYFCVIKNYKTPW